MKKPRIDSRIDKKTPRKYTLRFTLTSAFCGLTLLGSLFLSLVTSHEVGSFIREQLRLRLTDVVNIMASQIDGDLHSQVQTIADQKSKAFTQLQSKLLEMRKRGTEIDNVYTMRKTNTGQVMFVVDVSEKNLSPTGEIYSNPTDTLKDALNAPAGTKIAYSEPEPTADNWGIWLSAYAPIFTTSGQLDGIVGVDVSAKNLLEHERNYKITVYALSTAVVLMMLPLGFFIAHRIRRPLAQLTIEMEKVRKFDLDSEVKIVSRIREIDSMVQQLENMKRGLRSFRKYVPADLVQELIELGVDAKLGGEKKTLTIFFSDIANFTSMSEKLAPEVLVGFLGEYLNIMNACLLQNQATVDKYIGDGVMAFWGAPRFVDSPAIKACQAALDCQKQIHQLNQKWQADGLDLAFHTRIGINTGEVIVGNMGSDARMSYTVIGDNVNLTSRVESANKFYGTSILITETTYREVNSHFVTRLVDYAVLAGKAVPIQLYELIGNKYAVKHEKLQQIERYNSAFHLYSQRLFIEAVAILEELVSSTPSDRVPLLLLERCRHYIANPPSLDWQGNYVLPYK
ncbi:MAG: adenylate/guanylate cyclase domain-containing protein [Methylococcaceae bacterium]|nr:adenylate/guanylate cyclase domain-containing protein [Methylococcaceae bacterium]